MLVIFELSMPSNAAWNGKWTGADNCYAIIKSIRNPPKLGYYTHSFGDGWIAAVTVREISRTAAAKMRKLSKGFCGYDWMIDSIVQHGEIRA